MIGRTSDALIGSKNLMVALAYVPPTFIQETKIMASGPITSWQIDGETIETVTDFIFSGSKITADGNCSHEIKRSLLVGRKAMKNLDSVLNFKDITLATKVCTVKGMVFLVVMYGCESWTAKKDVKVKVAQWWPILCNPMDYTIHGFSRPEYQTE